MKDRWTEQLERDYAELDWPVPSRDVVGAVLAQVRPVRYPVWRLAAAAVLVLLVCGWWLMRAQDVPDAASLTWESDTQLAADLNQLQTRMKKGRSHADLSAPKFESISSRTGVLRGRMDRLKQTLEPEPPKTGVPVGTYGGNEDDCEIA